MSLVDARLQLHWAAQVLCAAADRWITRRAHDDHSNMEWRGDLAALVGNPAESGRRVGLRPADLTLLDVSDQGVEGWMQLEGRTLAEALGWADDRLAAAAGELCRDIAVRDYDMPSHPVRDGAAFSVDAPALEELAGWYANGDALLREIERGEPGSTPIRCWPHHFDIGGIVCLDRVGADRPHDAARQIGYGLSPGDRHYAEPYFYVTPHPIPAGAELPPLDGGGKWHQEGFTGAVLVGSRDGAREFFRSAFAAAREIIPAR